MADVCTVEAACGPACDTDAPLSTCLPNFRARARLRRLARVCALLVFALAEGGRMDPPSSESVKVSNLLIAQRFLERRGCGDR